MLKAFYNKWFKIESSGILRGCSRTCVYECNKQYTLFLTIMHKLNTLDAYYYIGSCNNVTDIHFSVDYYIKLRSTAKIYSFSYEFETQFANLNFLILIGKCLILV